VVNYADHTSQCYIRLPFADLAGKTWRLQDKMGNATYDRDGESLQAQGLFVDLERWNFHIFDMTSK
jgi:hypothetical protein